MSEARNKIRLAALATKQMDELLGPAMDRLEAAIRVGNGAGIYADVSAVRVAMTRLKIAIIKAEQIDCRADWPTAADYDQ